MGSRWACKACGAWHRPSQTANPCMECGYPKYRHVDAKTVEQRKSLETMLLLGRLVERELADRGEYAG